MAAQIIQINGKPWTIKEVESNNSMLRANDEKNIGTSHFWHQEIYLDKSMSPDRKYQVLCHELAHAFLYETQLTDLKTFDEENLADFVGIYGKQIVDLANSYMRDSSMVERLLSGRE